MLVLLSGVVLAFMLTARTEYVASKSYEGGASARVLADSAVNLVIAQIREASTQPNLAWTSQPGLIRTFAVGGAATKSYKLYSADSLIEPGSVDPALATDLPATAAEWKQQPSLWTDLNAPVADLTKKDPFNNAKPLLNYPIFDGGHLQAIADPTTPGSTPLQMSLNKDGNADIEGFKVDDRYADSGVSMPVKWLYMLKDGTLVPAKASTAPGAKQGDVDIIVPTTPIDKTKTAQGDFNSIVARVAFWTDDETAKVNINTASEGTFADTPMASAMTTRWAQGMYANGFFPDTTWEIELANRQGAAKEYQRYPGHPATTSLSPIFGRQLLLRTSINQNRAKMAEEIFKFIPRVSGRTYNRDIDPTYSEATRQDVAGTKQYDNSSQAGTVRAGGAAGGYSAEKTYSPVTPDSDRLYATIDEFIYNPNFATNANQDTKRNGWLLAEPDPANKRDTTREMLEMSKFFLTANSKAPEQNLYNLPRISVWPEMMLPADQAAGNVDRRTAFDKLIAFCSTVGNKDPLQSTATTNPHQPFYFTRQSSGSSGMLVDATGKPTTVDPKGDLAPGISPSRPSRNLYLMAYLRGLTQRPAPGWDASATAQSNFASKYGTDSNQILTEIFDYIRSTNLVDRTGSPASMTVINFGDSPTPNLSNYSYTQTATAKTNSQTYNGLVIPEAAFFPDAMHTSARGEVVPIQMAFVNGLADGTRGIGRFPTITEIALVATRLPDTITPLNYVYPVLPDRTTLGAYATLNADQKAYVAACYTGTATAFPGYAALTPAEKTAFDTTFIDNGTLASPKALIQFALIPQLSNPMAGYCTPSLTSRITFSNINMTVQVMDSTGTPVQTGTPFSLVPPATLASLYSPGTGASFGGILGSNSYYPGYSLPSSGSNWGKYSAPPTDTMIVPLAFPTPNVPAIPASRWENPSRAKSSDASVGPQIDKVRAIYASSNYLNISCTADVTISGPVSQSISGAPVPVNPGTEPIIQTLHISFPAFDAPIPFLTPIPRTTNTLFNGLTTATPAGEEKFDAAGNQIGQSNINNVAFDPFRYIVDPVTRFAGLKGVGNTRIFANRALDYTERDVVRTLSLTGNRSGLINPATNIGMQGDTRIISAKKDVLSGYLLPSDQDFYSNKYVYIGQNSMHGPTDTMSFAAGGNGQNFGEINSTHGALVKGEFGANQGDFNTAYVKNPAINAGHPLPTGYYNTRVTSDPWGGNKGYGASAIPATESISGKASRINGVKNYLGNPGDWDTGPFWLPDGPYCNKADEGAGVMDGTNTPYFSNDYAHQNIQIESQTFFSPNRMIPSPVMFGSLPTGTTTDHPWQTLLFRPAKYYLPGGNGSNDTVMHPGSAKYGPPDHLLLDLFWMPVVEPYAISEPFATAGKINLNQQIAPFINIRRDTALRAVLKAVKIGAVNPRQIVSNQASDTYSYYYKHMVQFGPATGCVIRRSIDLDNTIKQITDRLDKNKPFVSASEICDIPLIPKDIPLVTDPDISPPMKPHVTTGFTPSTALADFDGKLAAFWSKHTYTGDNMLEKPYALIYPRLTTRSNTYTVHVRVQTLAQSAQRDAAKSYTLKYSQSQPTGEFRGSFLIERYLDANSAGLVDATLPNQPNVPAPTSGDTTGLALGPYRFRVVSSKQFTP